MSENAILRFDHAVTAVEKGANAGQAGLKTVVFPSCLQVIGESAFENCTDLEEITFPGTLMTVGQNAFKGCVSLKKVIFPASLKAIQAGAFSGCISLKEVTFRPGEVKRFDGVHIGEKAFENCTALEEITFQPGVESVASDAFSGCAGLKRAVFMGHLIPPESLAACPLFYVNQNGPAEKFAAKNRIPFVYNEAAPYDDPSAAAKAAFSYRRIKYAVMNALGALFILGALGMAAGFLVKSGWLAWGGAAAGCAALGLLVLLVKYLDQRTIRKMRTL